MIYKAHDLESALRKAEEELKLSREYFIYEYKEQKSGLFKGKEIILEIKKLKKDTLCGIKDGKLIIQRGDNKATLIPDENVILKVNNKCVRNKISINGDEEIEIIIINSECRRSMAIEIEEDKLTAYLKVSYEKGKIYNLKEIEPINELYIETVVIDEKKPEVFTKGDVEKILCENKIKYGIKWESINDVLNGGTTVIAEGKKVEMPIDDKIDYFFNNEKTKVPIEVDGKVDYLNKGEVSFVESGKLLATKIDGKDGIPGVNVHGETVMPPKRRKIKFLCGPGCETFDDGNKIRSTINGMPCVKGDRICVFPVHKISGDVDITTGNIEFNGDIHILGDVKEGMEVKAGNSILIKGNVAEGKIHAKGDIIIEKNVISSEIHSGEKQITEKMLIDTISLYHDFLNSLNEAVNEVLANGKLSKSIGLEQIMKVLLESKFKFVKEIIDKGNNIAQSKDINEKLKELWSKINNFQNLILQRKINKLDEVLLTKKLISNFIETYTLLNTPADVSVGYCQNSKIFATNDVEVKGKGCYNTIIIAENNVLIYGKPGVLRGGQVVTGGNIKVREVGSNAGVPTVLKTTKKGIIEAEIAYNNTILCFDEITFKLEYPVKKLKAYISKGELIVEKLKF